MNYFLYFMVVICLAAIVLSAINAHYYQAIVRSDDDSVDTGVSKDTASSLLVVNIIVIVISVLVAGYCMYEIWTSPAEATVITVPAVDEIITIEFNNLANTEIPEIDRPKLDNPDGSYKVDLDTATRCRANISDLKRNYPAAADADKEKIKKDITSCISEILRVNKLTRKMNQTA